MILGGRKPSLVAVELQLTPTKHVREKERTDRIRLDVQRFQGLLQTFASQKWRSCLRISFRHGRGRILLLGRGKVDVEELREQLLSKAKTFLTEFRASPVEPPTDEDGGECHSILVTGVPEPRENPVEPLARYFLENGYDGDYDVVVEHTWVNPISELLAQWKQRDAARDSMRQQTEERWWGRGQDTRTTRDRYAEIRFEDAMKELERTSSALALKVWVYLSGRAPTKEGAKRIAEGAASVVMGTLSSHRKDSALKTHQLKKMVLPLEPVGDSTLMLPSEAVPLFWIPQMAMGGEVAPTTEFEMPPPLPGEILLGTAVSQSGQVSHNVMLRLEALRKHLFLTAMTGGGKTTTAFNLLLQLDRLGIPFLVIEPVKNEYRSLLASIRNLQVFTLGDDTTAPFRLNIFEPPAGVKVQTHLENLKAAWNASFVMYAPLPYVILQILAETYGRCGWDIKGNVRGRPIGFEDFLLATEKVTRRLRYEEKITMNIEAAFNARVASLTLGAKGSLFNAVSSIPIERILERPTVIELKDIRDGEEKAFVMALLVNNIVERIELLGGSRRLRHVMVIEEAHELLPDISTEKGDPEAADPRRRLVEQMAKLLATVRAYGLGMVIVEQIPTKIIRDAIKNTATKIVHRLPDEEDRKRMAGAMNMTEEQAAVLGVLKPGEAVIHLEEHPLPIRIRVPDVIAERRIPVWQVPDEDVARRMAPFYRQNPLPKEAAPASDDISPFVRSERFREAFVRGYEEWFNTGSSERLLTLLLQESKKRSADVDELIENVSRILREGSELYLPYREKDRERFPRLFMKYAANSIKDGRRP